MSKERKHHDFPDRETLLEYLKGGLSFHERHRIEKLMLEHKFFREVVEGLETEDPELIAGDLESLSGSLYRRSGLTRGGGFNLYKLAASISLIILASVIIFVTMEWLTRSNRAEELSLNKSVQTEADRNSHAQESTGIVPDKETGKEKTNITAAQKNEIPEKPGNADVILPATPPEKRPDEVAALNTSRQNPVEAEKSTRKPRMDMEISADVPPDNIQKNRLGDTGSRKMNNNEPEAAAVPLSDEDIAPATSLKKSSSGMTLPYSTATSLPVPVGGFDNYQKYLDDSLRYPEAALEHKIEGLVIVSFTVGTDSIPRNLSVINSLGYGCDQEARRLITQGPEWLPAVSDGKAVEAEMTLPIRFSTPAER